MEQRRLNKRYWTVVGQSRKTKIQWRKTSEISVSGGRSFMWWIRDEVGPMTSFLDNMFQKLRPHQTKSRPTNHEGDE